MEYAVRKVDGLSFVSLPAAAAAVAGLPPGERLNGLLRACGVRFHASPYDRFVAAPVVALAGIGGLLFDWEPDDPADTVRLHELTGPLPVESLRRAVRNAGGASAFFTYLNPRDRSLAELGDTALRLGHRSVLHAAAATVLIAGHTSAVEHELATQRDLVHLSRLTVNRTMAQSDPPLRIADAELLPAADEIMRMIRQRLPAAGGASLDELECRNALFPAAKASVVLLSGTMRNLMKVAASGVAKEAELGGLASRLSAHITALCRLPDEVSGPPTAP
ncbi:hypothetical protein GCM10025331_10820 [Actinoplanes utahensis]|uniref:Uncharacterized protein n=2 Tax=Actinoplanes utahensis TaxID=1869 RepID=A0A0A6WWK4_ACTUT|nr:hypothetical protein MB27_42300 [Actinoplanes utahensis]GIF28820.1 hypothetical protein Aut01nite_18060 [Actinoplanes utahensis]